MNSKIEIPIANFRFQVFHLMLFISSLLFHHKMYFAFTSLSLSFAEYL